MAKRGGPGISVKMILTTTLLILLTVVGFGVWNVRNIRKVYDQSTREEIKQIRAGRESQGEAGTLLFARAIEPQLTNNQLEELSVMVQTMVPQDTRDKDGKKD